MTNGAQPTTVAIPCPRCQGTGRTFRESQSGPDVPVPCMRCDGRPGCKVEVAWRTSSRDNKTHVMFVRGDFAEAVCGHCVPLAILVDRPAHGACTACAELLVALLGLLSDQRWRASME